MPISQKINEEIEKLSINKNEKRLLKNILVLEDAGLRNFKAPYEKQIDAYIKAEDEIVDKGGD